MKRHGNTSPAEFRAACIIICILILSATLPDLYDRIFPAEPPVLPMITTVHLAQDSVSATVATSHSPKKHRANTTRQKYNKNYYDRKPDERKTHAPEPRTIVCKPFDPNTVSAEELVAMGVGNYIPQNIEKYRAAGGKFRNAEDLGRIYGLDSATLNALLPCIGFQSIPSRQSPSYQGVVDINTAGLDAWKALPGIGDVLADRIIRFRDRLGGFHTVGQIADTAGLPPETFEMIAERLTITEGPQLIDLNRASIEELRSHPFITFRQAQAIVNYRQHHGKFAEVKEVMQVLSLSTEWLEQMAPYLTCDPIARSADLAVR
jgi:DNA uptake protein ComE-like DNA-binding protein